MQHAVCSPCPLRQGCAAAGSVCPVCHWARAGPPSGGAVSQVCPTAGPARGVWFPVPEAALGSCGCRGGAVQPCPLSSGLAWPERWPPACEGRRGGAGTGPVRAAAPRGYPEHPQKPNQCGGVFSPRGPGTAAELGRAHGGAAPGAGGEHKPPRNRSACSVFAQERGWGNSTAFPPSTQKQTPRLAFLHLSLWYQKDQKVVGFKDLKKKSRSTTDWGFECLRWNL